MQRLLTTLVLATTAALGQAQQTVNTDFESGTLGWVGPAGGGGMTGVLPTAGNGGGAGFRTIFNNFFVTFFNDTNAAYLGDYSQFDSVTLSIDVKVNLIEFFFSPVPRPWLVELRNYDLAQGGYPWTSVWFKWADISEATHGDWTTFSVTIDDPTATALPAGWRGYGAEDPVTFEPQLPAGVTFADVLAGVDEVAFTTGEPGFFFGFTDFDLVLDNIKIETTGGPFSDLGNGLAGADGTPQMFGDSTLLGGDSTLIGLSNAAPNSVAFLGVGTANVNLPFFGGTLVPSGDAAILPLVTDNDGFLPYTFDWPAGLAPGADLFWQYWVVDPSGPEGLTASNALVCTTP